MGFFPARSEAALPTYTILPRRSRIK